MQCVCQTGYQATYEEGRADKKTLVKTVIKQDVREALSGGRVKYLIDKHDY